MCSLDPYWIIKNNIRFLQAFATNISSQNETVCGKFYGSQSPYKWYGDNSPNNLFALFKINHYKSNSKCDTKVIQDLQILIKDMNDLPEILVDYISNNSNCLLIKDIAYRFIYSICTNFKYDVHFVLLMIIMMTIFDCFIFCFFIKISLVNFNEPHNSNIPSPEEKKELKAIEETKSNSIENWYRK